MGPRNTTGVVKEMRIEDKEHYWENKIDMTKKERHYEGKSIRRHT